MENVGWLLLVGAIFTVYLAVIIATIDGGIRAYRERHLPPWLVGLGAFLLLLVADESLGNPLAAWGGLLAIAGGIIAGALYGLRRRRLVAP